MSSFYKIRIITACKLIQVVRWASCASHFTSANLFLPSFWSRKSVILFFCLFLIIKSELFLSLNLSNKLFIIFVYCVQLNLWLSLVDSFLIHKQSQSKYQYVWMFEMVKTPYKMYLCLFNIHLRWGKVLSHGDGGRGTDLELREWVPVSVSF